MGIGDAIGGVANLAAEVVKWFNLSAEERRQRRLAKQIRRVAKAQEKLEAIIAKNEAERGDK